MAYNFLGLVNKVNRRLNEVELTSNNFATATGFYSQAKDAVNASVRDINQQEYNWPFNHVTQEDVLTANTIRYGFPDDLKVIDMDSFRLKENSTLSVKTKHLKSVNYEDYLQNQIHLEYSEDNNNSGVPNIVVQTPALEYALVPPPDKAYTIVYEYYRVPVDLDSYSDVPDIPERFQHVIVDGAMHYAYLFRGNTQDALVAKEKFTEGLKSMRSLLINRYDYVRSNMLVNSQNSVPTLRVN